MDKNPEMIIDSMKPQNQDLAHLSSTLKMTIRYLNSLRDEYQIVDGKIPKLLIDLYKAKDVIESKTVTEDNISKNQERIVNWADHDSQSIKIMQENPMFETKKSTVKWSKKPIFAHNINTNRNFIKKEYKNRKTDNSNFKNIVWDKDRVQYIVPTQKYEDISIMTMGNAINKAFKNSNIDNEIVRLSKNKNNGFKLMAKHKLEFKEPFEIPNVGIFMLWIPPSVTHDQIVLNITAHHKEDEIIKELKRANVELQNTNINTKDIKRLYRRKKDEEMSDNINEQFVKSDAIRLSIPKEIMQLIKAKGFLYYYYQAIRFREFERKTFSRNNNDYSKKNTQYD